MATASVETLEVLKANIGNLSADDQEFANSLLTGKYGYYTRGKLSDKQWYWAGKLAEKATTPPEPQITLDLGNFGAVMKLFDTAAKNLKSPKIRLVTPSGVHFNLTRGREGDVRVRESKGSYKTLGWVSPEGEFTPYRNVDEVLVVEVAELMAEMGDMPAQTAAKYGQMTKHCCFCAIELTDERSLAVGYGKTCAGHYALPWG